MLEYIDRLKVYADKDKETLFEGRVMTNFGKFATIKKLYLTGPHMDPRTPKY